MAADAWDWTESLVKEVFGIARADCRVDWCRHPRDRSRVDWAVVLAGAWFFWGGGIGKEMKYW